MRREEEERRERYAAGQTLLYKRERDIALASYDGEAAAGAILALGEAINGPGTAAMAAFLYSEADVLHEYGEIAAATCISSLRSHCGEDFWRSLRPRTNAAQPVPISATRLQR